MIIAPQSNVRILRGIPWTRDRKHTRYFDTQSEQNTYMANHVKFNLTNFTYIREQNVIRVPINNEDLVDCNYISFSNRGFGTKVFYAFITDKKYVNNETSEISFEIDEFQTYWFNVTIGNCYVEREHVADDTVGLHTLDEGIGTGELIVQEVWNRYWDDNPATAEDKDKGFTAVFNIKPTLLGDFLGDDPIVYEGNQLAPIQIKADPISDAGRINSLMKDASLTGYEIGNGYMTPKEFLLNNGRVDVRVDGNGIKRPSSYSYVGALGLDKLPYIPKNKKLLCYPYTKLLVTSSAGGSQEYRWENTTTGDVRFKLIMNVVNKPSCLLSPTNYDSTEYSRLKDLPINDFPEVNLGSYDSLNPKNIINGIGNSAGAIAQVMTSNNPIVNPIGAMTQVANSVTGLLLDTPKGNVGTMGDNLALFARMVGYTFYVMGVTGENAEIIDSYFQRFGYKVNKIKVPELHSREYWNYVKTKECEVHGNAPMEALETITKMFDSGVTLWHINNVGDFSGDNKIITT